MQSADNLSAVENIRDSIGKVFTYSYFSSSSSNKP